MYKRATENRRLFGGGWLDCCDQLERALLRWAERNHIKMEFEVPEEVLM